MMCAYYMKGAPEGSPKVVLWRSRDPATPGLQGIALIHYTTGASLFVAFPWVETSTGPGGFMICVFINMTGTPEGSTESGFMEKPGIEPATPGLQGIALIHYTTGAS